MTYLESDIVAVCIGIHSLMAELEILAGEGHYQQFGVDWQKRLEEAAFRVEQHMKYASFPKLSQVYR